jgi:hypothetical protein
MVGAIFAGAVWCVVGMHMVAIYNVEASRYWPYPLEWLSLLAAVILSQIVMGIIELLGFIELTYADVFTLAGAAIVLKDVLPYIMDQYTCLRKIEKHVHIVSHCPKNAPRR